MACRRAFSRGRRTELTAGELDFLRRIGRQVATTTTTTAARPPGRRLVSTAASCNVLSSVRASLITTSTDELPRSDYTWTTAAADNQRERERERPKSGRNYDRRRTRVLEITIA